MTAAMPSLTELRREALAQLDNAVAFPLARAKEAVNATLRATVHLRDALIERLRREPGAAAAPRWRAGWNTPTSPSARSTG